ncbi:OmpA family protein [Pseudonocardia humida]|uniref:OmpA family protein n=1 Tax=Pseudonocardia humida TaxID=2800819 RepID=A0ABT1AD28_9PSEU|nr:OmpA family protein [Pseudonocardia humida]MCO1660913.1 OmpA family protein [Pseudonocardia humida]
MSRAGPLIALLVGLAVAAPSALAQQPDPPPPDAVGAVQDIVGAVESLDGTEQQSREGDTVTVALAGDVLFAFDSAELTTDAHTRLDGVAAKIAGESARGGLQVHGHADDQGSDAYNDDLSQRRAEAVEAALEQRLAGTGLTVDATGHGEREPRRPNVVDGVPDEENRAENRRVEIVYRLR